MVRKLTSTWWIMATLVAVAAALSTTTATAAGAQDRDEKEQQQSNDRQSAERNEPEEVEFFDAYKNGKIDVRVVAGSYALMALRVRNVTKTPLKVELPKTFAAVPVARMQAKQRMQAQGYNANLSSNYGQDGGSQGLGGSLGGPWWGDSLVQNTQQVPDNQAQDGNAQDQPQYLMIRPGRFVQAQIPSFCLEYGKPDPNSRIPYVICPLDDLNNKRAVAELIDRFAKQGVNQHVAQLAAWHIANNVPWPMLAQVQFPRTRNSRGHRVTQMELLAAKRLAESLPSYGKHDSLSGHN